MTSVAGHKPDGPAGSGPPARQGRALPGGRGGGLSKYRRGGTPAVVRIPIQVLILAVFLALWQYLPEDGALARRFNFLNRAYISSPGDTAIWVERLVTGHGSVLVWPYLRTTITGAVLGAAIGLIAGAVAGLVFAESRFLSDIGKPFIVVLNSMPRIAFIPIIVLLVGPTLESSVINVSLVVFFLGFFNAFQGGLQVQQSVIENAVLLGANRGHIMFRIRSPYVLLWTFAAVPNAISFGIVVSVTNELLTGLQGMGALLLSSTANFQAGLTFGVITILAATGLTLFGLAQLASTRATRWLAG
jgi:NitT/TauT family transport system permease protein